MRVVHCTLKNGSGLHHVADSMAQAECALGLDSITVDSMNPHDWENGRNGDVYVIHSHIPDPLRFKGQKIVNIQHGTPEHVFQTAVETGLQGQYGCSDSFMISQYWLKTADVVVTFWPRHQKIWQTMCDKKTRVACVPMGIDRSFWQPVQSKGKFAGSPALLTAENCHTIKWPLDLFMLWPWVTEELPEARLHALYLPLDQHRWWFPLINANGTAFRSFVNAGTLDHNNLRNAFASVDYYIGLVRYGDFNRISMEAKAAGCKVISYEGNPYADYWLPEGDQRVMADELTAILRGEVQPLIASDVPDISETAKAMIEIYEGL